MGKDVSGVPMHRAGAYALTRDAAEAAIDELHGGRPLQHKIIQHHFHRILSNNAEWLLYACNPFNTEKDFDNAQFLVNKIKISYCGVIIHLQRRR